MLAFFHRDDYDGYCSGAIIKKKFQSCRMVGITYTDTFDYLKLIKQDERVYIVDFSFKPDDMKKIISITKNIVWIDHHTTAIKELFEFENILGGIRDTSKAACQLTWEYIYPDAKLPKAVEFLAKWDIWQHDDKNTVYFQYGIKTKGLIDPDNIIWDSLLDSNSKMFLNFIEPGKIAFAYRTQFDKDYCRDLSFETEFEGHKCIVLNIGHSGSNVFDSIWDNHKYDMMILFVMIGRNQYKCSLYSPLETIHVGDIAVKYGGGGHPNAAGFECKSLPFLK